ncbi:MAG: iron uptake porin [Spirulina sp.]
MVPAILGLSVLGAGLIPEAAVAAQPRIAETDLPAPTELAQITSVSELTDVSPSDWAFQALQSLVENYGCIQGYPDRTFRGSRALTRYEFAAGLNACLDVMAALIAQGGVSPDDLEAIRRLQGEFQTELLNLGRQVAFLEAEAATLRSQQFSTTTKLRGEANIHVGVPFDTLQAANATGTTVVLEDSTSVAGRIRLTFDSSFSGEDRLRIRFQSRSGTFLTPVNGLNRGGDSYPVSENFNVEIDNLYYRFPLGQRVNVTASARGMSGSDWVTSTILPYHGPSVAEAGRPQFYLAGGSPNNGAGLGMNIAFTDHLILDLGYTAAYPGAADPAVGIFAAAGQSYMAQLNFLTDGVFDGALVYLHNDRSSIFTGGAAGAVDTYAGLMSLTLGQFFIAGHGAFQSFNGGDDFSWTAGLGVNDWLVQGSKLGLYGGQLPQTNFRGLGRTSNPVLIEGYYEVPVNRNLTLTPALIYGDANLVNPTGTNDDTTFYGALRATFRF